MVFKSVFTTFSQQACNLRAHGLQIRAIQFTCSTIFQSVSQLLAHRHGSQISIHGLQIYVRG